MRDGVPPAPEYSQRNRPGKYRQQRDTDPHRIRKRRDVIEPGERDEREAAESDADHAVHEP